MKMQLLDIVHAVYALEEKITQEPFSKDRKSTRIYFNSKSKQYDI